MIVGWIFQGKRLGSTLGLIALTGTVALAQDADPTFSAPFLSEENASYKYAVSPDKKAMSIDFGGLNAILDARVDLPSVMARSFYLVLPLAGGESGIKLAIKIQGFVGREDAVDVSLLSVANGEAHPMDFASLAPSQDDLIKNENCDQAARQAAEMPERPDKPAGKANPFLQCFTLDSSAARDLRLSLFLLINRREKNREGQLHITAVDATVEGREEPPKD